MWWNDIITSKEVVLEVAHKGTQTFQHQMKHLAVTSAQKETKKKKKKKQAISKCHRVLGGCQQTSSVYEIIFSLSEHLNELLHLFPVPVFNFFSMNPPLAPVPFPPVALNVLLTRPQHTSATWKCLCFTGVLRAGV